MVDPEIQGAPHRSRPPDHPRSSRFNLTYCGVPENKSGIFLGCQKSSMLYIFFFFLVFSSNSRSPKRTPVFFFRLAFEKLKSSFLFFFWAEAETRKSVYLKSGLRRAFWSKIGPQNSTHVFSFFFVWGWLENGTHMLVGERT